MTNLRPRLAKHRLHPATGANRTTVTVEGAALFDTTGSLNLYGPTRFLNSRISNLELSNSHHSHTVTFQGLIDNLTYKDSVVDSLHFGAPGKGQRPNTFNNIILHNTTADTITVFSAHLTRLETVNCRINSIHAYTGDMETVVVKNSTVDAMCGRLNHVTVESSTLDMLELSSNNKATTVTGSTLGKVSLNSVIHNTNKPLVFTNNTAQRMSICYSWLPSADFTGTDLTCAELYGTYLFAAKMPNLTGQVEAVHQWDNMMRYYPSPRDGEYGLWIIPTPSGWHVAHNRWGWFQLNNPDPVLNRRLPDEVQQWKNLWGGILEEAAAFTGSRDGVRALQQFDYHHRRIPTLPM